MCNGSVQQARPRRTVGLLVAASICLLAASGCSEDGKVDARGKVLLDGSPVGSGRLILRPVGEGQQAESLLAEDGAFALRTKGELGAWPGEYRAAFRRTLTSSEAAEAAQREAVSSSELTIMYQGPPDKTVTIPEGGAEDLVVDIRADQGWTQDMVD